MISIMDETERGKRVTGKRERQREVIGRKNNRDDVIIGVFPKDSRHVLRAKGSTVSPTDGLQSLLHNTVANLILEKRNSRKRKDACGFFFFSSPISDHHILI